MRNAALPTAQGVVASDAPADDGVPPLRRLRNGAARVDRHRGEAGRAALPAPRLRSRRDGRRAEGRSAPTPSMPSRTGSACAGGPVAVEEIGIRIGTWRLIHRPRRRTGLLPP